MNIICAVRGHRRNRRRVWHDGMDWRSDCSLCGEPMLKAYPEGWRLFDRSRDFHLDRSARPDRS